MPFVHSKQSNLDRILKNDAKQEELMEMQNDLVNNSITEVESLVKARYAANNKKFFPRAISLPKLKASAIRVDDLLNKSKRGKKEPNLPEEAKDDNSSIYLFSTHDGDFLTSRNQTRGSKNLKAET